MLLPCLFVFRLFSGCAPVSSVLFMRVIVLRKDERILPRVLGFISLCSSFCVCFLCSSNLRWNHLMLGFTCVPSVERSLLMFISVRLFGNLKGLCVQLIRVTRLSLILRASANPPFYPKWSPSNRRYAFVRSSRPRRTMLLEGLRPNRNPEGARSSGFIAKVMVIYLKQQGAVLSSWFLFLRYWIKNQEDSTIPDIHFSLFVCSI